jgi:hypothetical protein
MTVSSSDLVTAVSKLNDLTRRKLVSWTAADRSAYYAPYEGRTFRITELGPSPADRRYDKNSKPRYKLEILDERNIPIFEFPEVQGISDLFASVRARAGDVEGLIRSLLNAK